ncbi:CDP-diacylglycerol--serine O-phosphatidyltransferase [Olivibacter sp. SDN3]|uniref:CDP-diacylglycerol--serine O-phosphatidyltransferase n=1 Tax=Olivibacter sp. SDN3 TaxID=2764720 RepID=UPI0016518247|nr:CDP-diacylglycerol--serine O-phosphatidyltransferase [Olivibacter sp. SDN3]QNL49536.1 CDP-diacylglycerol--serine O-phosphatidyltransferase [Olivibacter sp. SDN3]
MKKHIPNIITCLNLFSGCVGIVLAFNGQLIDAGYAILVAAFFDFMDGMAARILNVSSPMGKELDSLADMVSFGLLPAIIVFQMLQSAPAIEYDDSWIKYTAFLLAIFSALRLAKFNLDQRQTTTFIGLPTPACALFILSLPHIAMSSNPIVSAYVQNPVILLILILTLSFLLIAEIPLISLKFNNLNFRANGYRYILLIVSVCLLAFLQLTAIPLIIIVYIILSLIQHSRLPS